MKRLSYTLLAISAIGTVQSAQADLRDAGDFNAGGFVVTPKLKATTGYNDNITTAPNNELSANVYTLAPEVNAKTQFGDFVGLDLDTKAEKGVFSGQAFNNYYDYSFGTELSFRISNKQSLALEYDFVRAHDPAGSPNATSPTLAIEKYRVNKGGLSYRLGNEESIARLELALRGEGKRYKDASANTKDFDAEIIDAAVFAAVAPKTEAFVQAIASEYDYLNNADTLDNDDQKIYLGVQWQATAKTSGSIKIGQQEKEYTNRTPQVKQDETIWEAGVKWEPKSYSAFTLGLSSQVDNGNGNDTVRTEDAVERSTAALGWIHNWSEDLKTTVGTSLTNEDYFGGTRNGIEADIVAFNAGLEFQVERNFTIHMNFNYTDKNADPANNTAAAITTARNEEYSQNSAVVFGVEIGL